MVENLCYRQGFVFIGTMGKKEANEKRAVFSTKGEVSVTQVVRVRITDTIWQRHIKYKQSSTEGDALLFPASKSKDRQKAKRVGGNDYEVSSGEFEIASSAKQARSKRSRDTNPSSAKFKNTD